MQMHPRRHQQPFNSRQPHSDTIQLCRNRRKIGKFPCSSHLSNEYVAVNMTLVDLSCSNGISIFIANIYNATDFVLCISE